MKKLIVLLLVVLLVAYIYHSNPRVIDDLTKKAREKAEGIDSGNENPGNDNGNSAGTNTGEKGFSGSGWAGNGSEGDVYIGEGFGAVRVNSTYVLFLDRNDDGKIDAVYLDTTGDGNYDTKYLDQNYDGKTDEWVTTFNGEKSYAWDLTGDGIADVYDTDGDGKVDAWDINSDGVIDERDVDGDGNPDLHDMDFDGVFDEFQGGPVLASPENETAACPQTVEDAYRLYVQAYNNVTKLQAQYNDEPSDELKEKLEEAYGKYEKAKACYESFTETESGTERENITGELGGLMKATLSTNGSVGIRFSTGEIFQTLEDWEKMDIALEPWCVDYPAILGHYVDIGAKSLEELTVGDIPASGYPAEEGAMEVVIGHVYVNRNSDGSYTAFTLVSHERIGDCGHVVEIEYRNAGR
ncbi:calcium-binding protein [Thermococcus indicus]|uniref:Calcium-binding protein n=1 Tax=Thermococcus indicus TaxID=2586643 RepID=A0A4Y5SMI6_9EURY|nr:calcium-binding protein [Thermococcus indicus]QDA32106.1 calcium-binding protein [Thermococcus indicus]